VTVISLQNSTGRIYANVPMSVTLDMRITSLRKRNLRMAELESQKAQIKKVLLLEVLDLAAELQATVGQHGLSVAEVARRASIAERDAQRLYKLPIDNIRQEIAQGEAQYGPDYRYPSWRTRVPGHRSSPVTNEPAPNSDIDKLHAELGAARKEIDRLKAISPPRYYAKHFQGGNDERPTPLYISEWLAERFGPFDWDVCADALNAKAPDHFDKETDALKQQWICDNGFMNPPYSKVGEFCQKAYEETRSGRAKRIVALLPAYITNGWFLDFVWHARLHLPRGRITFEGMKAGAPFSSVIAV
jgi:phage N-6-adenine-methyltransferase